MNLNDHTEAGLSALASQDLETAEKCFRAVLALDADNAQAHFSLAQIHGAAGRLDQAQEAAVQAVRNGASIDGLLFLANLAGSRSDWDEGEKWLAQLVALKPGHREAWILRSQFATARGDATAGGAHMRTAVDHAPDDFALLNTYIHLRNTNLLNEDLAAIEKFLDRNKANPEAVCKGLWLLVQQRERNARAENGLPLTHGATLDDFHFKFAQRETADFRAAAAAGAAAAPDSKQFTLMRALATLACGDISGAEADFAKLRSMMRPGNILASVHLDAPFFADTANLADTAIDTTLPRVDMMHGDFPERGRVILTSCDIAYFRTYGWEFIDSLSRHSSGVHLHVHIFDVTEGERAVLVPMIKAAAGALAVSVSREWTGLCGGDPKAAKGYYHAVRFIRFYQFLRSRRVEAWMVDADSSFDASPQPLFDRLRGHDAALWVLPGRMEPHSQIAAGLVGVAPTVAGIGFLRRVAGYIAHYLNAGTLPWGIDQVALFASYTQSAGGKEPLRATTVPPTFYATDGNTGCIVSGQKSDTAAP